MFYPSTMGVAGGLQGVGDTIKDPYSSDSSGIKSAFSQLALNLASAAGNIGIQKLASTTNTNPNYQSPGVNPMSLAAPPANTGLILAGLLVAGIAIVGVASAVRRR